MHDVCTESTNIQAFRFAPDLTMACNVMLHYVLLIDTLLVLFRKYSTLSQAQGSPPHIAHGWSGFSSAENEHMHMQHMCIQGNVSCNVSALNLKCVGKIRHSRGAHGAEP